MKQKKHSTEDIIHLDRGKMGITGPIHRSRLFFTE